MLDEGFIVLTVLQFPLTAVGMQQVLGAHFQADCFDGSNTQIAILGRS